MSAPSAAQLATGSGTQPTTAPGNQFSLTTEYTVRVPNDKSKKYSMMKFSSGTNLDFLKLTNTSVRMERENNLRAYKSVYNIDSMPKFGAGSEYGREQKEEARRKKYGINVKQYNANDQPWQMKVGKGKDAKRFKGVREGTITENTAYYVFTQCADGAFEAFPVEEWYNFQPVVQYKYLDSEEAEEEFTKGIETVTCSHDAIKRENMIRRDKTMNFFSIMVRKRIKNDPDAPEEEGAEKEVKKKSKEKKDKSLILTDMDDWDASSEEEEIEEDEKKESKPKKDEKKGKKSKKRKNAKMNADDEAVEESDEGDFDDRELDYISDSGSESELDEKGKQDKYDDQGVDQERGLKKLIDSDVSSDDEEEEEKKEEEDEAKEEEDIKEKKSKKKTKDSKDNKDDEESDSSSSSSDSDDSDIDKNEDKFNSVLFMQKKKGSRPNTPTLDPKSDQKTEGTKRKMESDDTPDSQKKMRIESPAPGGSSQQSGEITEEAIRRYLLRRPTSAKEIVQKFRSKKPQLSKDQMTQKIGQLLKKINPEKKVVNGTLMLFLSEKKKD